MVSIRSAAIEPLLTVAMCRLHSASMSPGTYLPRVIFWPRKCVTRLRSTLPFTFDFCQYETYHLSERRMMVPFCSRLIVTDLPFSFSVGDDSCAIRGTSAY